MPRIMRSWAEHDSLCAANAFGQYMHIFTSQGISITAMRGFQQLPHELQQHVWEFSPEPFPAIAVDRRSRDVQLRRTDRCLRVQVEVSSEAVQGMEAALRALHHAAMLRAALPRDQHQRMHLIVRAMEQLSMFDRTPMPHAPLLSIVSPQSCQAALTQLTLKEVLLVVPGSTTVTLPNVTKVVVTCCRVRGAVGLGWLLDMLPAVAHVHVSGNAGCYIQEAAGASCRRLLGRHTRSSITLLDVCQVTSTRNTQLSDAVYLRKRLPHLQILKVDQINTDVISWLMESSQLQQLWVKSVGHQNSQAEHDTDGSSGPLSIRDAAKSPFTVYSQDLSLSSIDKLLRPNGLPRFAPFHASTLSLHLDTQGLPMDFSSTCHSLRERHLTFTGLKSPQASIRLTTDNHAQAAQAMSTFFDSCNGLSGFKSSVPTQEAYQRCVGIGVSKGALAVPDAPRLHVLPIVLRISQVNA